MSKEEFIRDWNVDINDPFQKMAMDFAFMFDETIDMTNPNDTDFDNLVSKFIGENNE